jgi:hypothetical protein
MPLMACVRGKWERALVPASSSDSRGQPRKVAEITCIGVIFVWFVRFLFRCDHGERVETGGLTDETMAEMIAEIRFEEECEGG